MPLKRRDPNANLVARELRRLADLIEGLKGAKPAGDAEASAHLELKQIGVRLQRISKTLGDGKKAGRTTPAQLRSMASNFKEIAKALERGATTAARRGSRR